MQVLPAGLAEHDARYEPNRICVAEPNRHLVIDDGFMQLPFRRAGGRLASSIDPLFAVPLGPTVRVSSA